MTSVKENNGRTMNRKPILIAGILLLSIVCIAVQYALPVYGSNTESSLGASVNVVPPFTESYGGSIAASHRCIFARAALGEPDGRGAVMFRGGWVSIELEHALTGCSGISTWAAKLGWGAPSFIVYVSADGSTWVEIGGVSCASRSYTRNDFDGDFGDVRYIGVKRYGPRWSLLLIDAVWARSQ